MKAGEIGGLYAYEPSGYPGPKVEWNMLVHGMPAQHRSVFPTELAIDLDIKEYDKLKNTAEQIMFFFTQYDIKYDVWSTANKSFHIHSAFTFGPDFKKLFSELPDDMKFGPRTVRMFFLYILKEKLQLNVDEAPIKFSDSAEFPHLIRAEMGPRLVNGKWYYKGFVTSSEEGHLPPQYPAMEWPPDSMPPTSFPISVFPSELVGSLMTYAKRQAEKDGASSGNEREPVSYSGEYFNLPCIRSIFHGWPIERGTATRGGNKGAKLVAIALYQDTKGYAKRNGMEKAIKISRQYQQNLIQRGKGYDFGADELRNWYSQAWISDYEHSCGEIIASFRTETFNPREKWCSKCPLDQKRRTSYNTWHNGTSNTPR